ncbi:hypothetical protein KDD17_01165 [Sulfitobacter albidus]|uniref:Putative Flp pilus-assembly TadG-like N-terminal domain-containing protein n=1 Tax=Sulfitobacter albidus TaxID=2829501 RepID=A0A975JE72_9RHOB|nr:pilus assembly protein TadG-related protein [Sulfitobacter albidus]QUJ76707.1 hypothetical protein KDD17_01165 [Sulfitobacter albidus]
MFRTLFTTFRRSQDGSMLALWAVSLVVFLGLLGMIFDLGRLGTTQAELQSYADNVALAAAAELDARPDALSRAQTAATSLIRDQQTFGEGATALTGVDDVTLTFYRPDTDGSFTRSAALETTSPFNARYVDVAVAPRNVPLGLGAILTSFRGAEINTQTSASAAATFEQEACNVAPVAVCLPALSLNADAAIGSTLELEASVNLGQLLPGNIGAVNTLTNALDGLSICAGLLGDQLTACLIAAREPETACSGRGGLEISLGVNGNELMESINTRFGETLGVASTLIGDDFAGAPNILQGVMSGNICEALPGGDDAAFPGDDCLRFGSCDTVGNGSWQVGRDIYVDTYYDGEDPFPEAGTRFEFYQAEIAASGQLGGVPEETGGGGLLGGLLGGVGDIVGGLTGQMCAPQEIIDPTRRLMVVAGIDCLNVDVQAGVSAPVVQYFEAFALGPARDGTLNVEITACLGNNCTSGDGRGNLDTEIRDIVRLVE